MVSLRYTYDEDKEEDCITLFDEKEELKTSFESNIILSPAEDAITVIDKLNHYEKYYGVYIKMLKENLEYYGWTEENFKDLLEDVEVNLE